MSLVSPSFSHAFLNRRRSCSAFVDALDTELGRVRRFVAARSEELWSRLLGIVQVLRPDTTLTLHLGVIFSTSAVAWHAVIVMHCMHMRSHYQGLGTS